MGSERKSYPRFRRDGGSPSIKLTTDDLAVLLAVYRHRFIRADDLYALFAQRSRDKLSRRLTSLYRNKYLDRPVAQIDRFRQGPNQALVYGLDNAGARIVAEQFGIPTGSADWRGRNRGYTRENLDHTLAITRFMVDLSLASRTRANVQLRSFDEILASAPAATQKSAPPSRWSVPVSWSSAKADVHVVPDAVFGLRVQEPNGAIQSHVFLEVDRGSMTILPNARARESEGFLYRATILRKLLAYAESARLRLGEAHLGIERARILFLTTSATRAQAMRETARAFIVEPGLAPAGLFLFGSHVDGIDPFSAALTDGLGRTAELLPPGQR